jgi:hypothetical protein
MSQLEQMYSQEKWRSYIVLYCMLHLHYSPSELVCQVVEPYHDKDDSKHYMVKSKKRDTCMLYLSNPTRIKKVTSKKFMHAIQQLSWVIHPNEDLDEILQSL